MGQQERRAERDCGSRRDSNNSAERRQNNGLNQKLGQDIFIGGDWANSATFTAGAGTVDFNAGSGTQTLNSGGTGAGNLFIGIFVFRLLSISSKIFIL